MSPSAGRQNRDFGRNLRLPIAERLTYYQKQQKDAGTYTVNADALAALSYPRKKDLEFVESVPTLTAKNYFAFLGDREKFITHRMIAKMYEA